jgi:hypothetical protein
MADTRRRAIAIRSPLKRPRAAITAGADSGKIRLTANMLGFCFGGAMKVAELEGALLGYWVAKAQGEEAHIQLINGTMPDYCIVRLEGEAAYPCRQADYFFRPSSKWKDGGPIIERERINLETCEPWHAPAPWMAAIDNGGAIENHCYGPTALVAAMRCFVASKYGETVPDSEVAHA